MPVAIVSFLGLLLALRRIPAVARALTAPGMASRLELPHSFRVAGVAFLITMALGRLPALHITSVSALTKARRAPLPANTPLAAAEV